MSFHPDFATDVRRHGDAYAQVSSGLGARFLHEIEAALQAIQASPHSAGHYVNTGSEVVRTVRRRNLRRFPFFILYGLADERLIVASLIPSRSDPLRWLARLR